jgi:hypothetical protein
MSFFEQVDAAKIFFFVFLQNIGKCKTFRRNIYKLPAHFMGVVVTSKELTIDFQGRRDLG